MNTDINELLLQSVAELPPLPDTVNKLKKYINEAGSNAETSKIVEIISSDPLVTAKLLQLANSPYYGFSREISTITQVITLLGINNVKNIIIADCIKENFTIDVSPYGLDTYNFLNACSDEISFISNWLNDEDKNLSHLLVPCAMLLRLGIVIFSNFLIQNGKDKEFLTFLKKNKFDDISVIENEFFGVDHISFLGFLLYRWNFDETLIESICFVRTPHSASKQVKKSAYALAIIDHIFAPYNGSSPFNIRAALALIKEAVHKGIYFNVENFLEKLPSKAKENLKKRE
ncbi:HDOD domain-containing protein [Campylobacter sp. MIT 21-1685]|uniref:HDOD domain-containing protein n=1 Tax=unclassified Campylobacter TaxID=2593542 RepID=UPI00224B5523|nr:MULTISPECIES: HDOD domain-containing protein [unclassified Campylobacter]MCX2683061.1 HDOD domain-containing protein [Campylobacter sp. MIT 21-1684]MCX2751343.1 HDOD domain-containing protein [Campylobacter sp. MIT 21-1682]MCX2807542.1 HDOD domain-containing protein [Campylobacter sp. MIT 21-1685]